MPRLKLFMEQHYNDLLIWRAGETPRKQRRKETKENFEKIRDVINFLIEMKQKKRGREFTQKDAKKTLKKILKNFD